MIYRKILLQWKPRKWNLIITELSYPKERPQILIELLYYNQIHSERWMSFFGGIHVRDVFPWILRLSACVRFFVVKANKDYKFLSILTYGLGVFLIIFWTWLTQKYDVFPPFYKCLFWFCWLAGQDSRDLFIVYLSSNFNFLDYW